VRGLEDDLFRAAAIGVPPVQVPDDVLDHHHGSIDHHSEIESAQ
jgi:hypothetical protein